MKSELYNEDCVKTMGRMPDSCIDLTVTSPPYDNLRKYAGYDFNFEEIATSLLRVTKRGGVVVWIVGDATINGGETCTSAVQKLYFKKIGFKVHDTMIFHKRNFTPKTHKRYEQCFEYMFVLVKGRIKTFNPIMKTNKYAGANTLRNGGWASNKDGSARRCRDGFTPVREFGIIPNIWTYSVGGKHTSKDSYVFQHPAVFPEQLAFDHIRSWTNKGDLVYDPMMGSGTVPKMARMLHRGYIGSEISEEYFKIAVRRVGECG